MKRLIIITLTLLAFSGVSTVQAQKLAFVDVQYILDNMPEYSTAQAELNRFSSKWQKEIEDRYAQIKKLKDSYAAESILLTSDMKTTRLDAIKKMEKSALELQTKRFGVKGDLFKKRQELIQPVQDQIYAAIKEVAGSSYTAVFDMSGQSNLLFANERYDKTDAVMKKLGIRPGENTGKNDGKSDTDTGTKPGSQGTPGRGNENNGGGTKPR